MRIFRRNLALWVILFAIAQILTLFILEWRKDYLARSHYEITVSCLKRNIFREAALEPREGKIMVGLVTRARTKARGFPKTICGVVWQKNAFSWTRSAKLRVMPKEGPRMREIDTIAREILRGEHSLPDTMKCALFYKRTDDVGVSERSKKFFAKLRPVGAVGSHTLYCLPPLRAGKFSGSSFL